MNVVPMVEDELLNQVFDQQHLLFSHLLIGDVDDAYVCVVVGVVSVIEMH
jgi:hypothetical protein